MDDDGRCPWGHDLAIGGCTSSYSHLYDLPVTYCAACRTARRRGAWAELDPAEQTTNQTAPQQGLALIAVPPSRRAGIGRIEVRLDRERLGYVGLALCSVERRAVIEEVEVGEPYRRHGFGRLLIAAAVARAPLYHWSTAAVPDGPARAFLAAVAPPAAIGEPFRCSHMRLAAGEPV
ncbi:GNAT family N-acetyltransferase [Amycolatopsis sacchari]|nr:GNAT family N-acetyltransferase [Amycolatopsis sacchari]